MNDRANLRRTLARWLAHKHLVWFLVSIAILLAVPSLGAGLVLDDHVHRMALLGRAPIADHPISRFDIFAFIKQNASVVRMAIQEGTLPWWTPEDLRLAFLRPVTSLTHVLDYALWADQPVWMHAHSLIWFGLSIVVAFALYRSVAPASVAAGIAAVLFAFDDAHSMAASWLSNRNSMVAGTLGMASLLCHVRFRQRGRSVHLVVACVLFLAALLAGEIALGFAGYIAAYALCLDSSTLRKRILGIAPYALIVAGWAVVYRMFGYGAQNSLLYVDPARDPLKFLGVLCERAPILIWSQFFWPPADFFHMLPKFARIAWSVSAVVLLGLVFWRLWGFLRVNRTARFWALGMGISTIPVCGTFPTDRLLQVLGIGAMGLLGEILYVLLFDESDQRVRSTWQTKLAVWVLIVVHVVLAPLSLTHRALLQTSMLRMTDRMLESFPKGAEQRTLVVLNVPEPLLCTQYPLWRAARDLAISKQIRCLGGSEAEVSVQRVDERTLLLRSQGYFDTAFAGLFGQPKPEQQVFEAQGMHIEIVERSSDARPTGYRMRFEAPLESEQFQWVVWTARGFSPVQLPKIGETHTLRGPSMLDLFAG